MHTIEWTKTGGKTHRVVFREELTAEQRAELRRQSWINLQLQNALGNHNPYAQSGVSALGLGSLGSLLGAQNAYGSAAWHAQQQARNPNFAGVTIDGEASELVIPLLPHKEG